jgi:phospholipase C
MRCKRFFSAIASLALVSCARSALPAPSVQPPSQEQATSNGNDFPANIATYIKHIVIIDQENRSFDDLFHGFPGADAVATGVGHGVVYQLLPVSLADPWDINHSHDQFLEDYDNGLGDGFDQEINKFTRGCANAINEPSCWILYGAAHLQTAFAYVPHGEIKPYWAMARRYALADRTFQSNNGPSYPSHQYMIAGEAGTVADNPSGTPWGCDASTNTVTTEVLEYGTTQPPVFFAATGVEAPGPFPCFGYQTIAHRLDKAHVSWSYYAPAPGANGGVIWSAFDAIWQVRFGADWYADVKSPETRIFNDIQSGSLAQVSWVTPSIYNSDHAGSKSTTGPDWVGSIVNAIGESQYWNDTAIVIFWDDWGGWYDHVIPPQYANPFTGAYEGLGFRVPLIVVSPYAKKHYVSHVQHEIASSLHFIEEVFNLGPVGIADRRADALRDMFDFKQRPIPFKHIPTVLNASDFLRQKPSFNAPDDD